ncbi:LPD5 domain-containing protein [Comamonas jiangduensis]|uniref:LPD5 domain-containing protein n=1 Tax=Comamonas jiangduensis TaxID=1194168 RepID=UPI003BF922B1
MAQNTDWDKGVLSPPASAATASETDWDSGTLTPPAPRRSIVGAINDAVIETANAAAGTASAVANFVRPGNAASQWIDKNIIEAGDAKQSDVVKAEKARYSQEMQDAQGMGDEVGATLGYVARNPLLAAAQAAGSFAVPGLAIKGAAVGARAMGLGAKNTTRAGLAAGAGVGAAGAGGDAAGTAYDLSREGGATDEQAVAAARGASVLPAAIGAAGGLVGAERLVAGAKGFGGGLVARALKTGAVEGAQEALEEGVTQYEGQRAAVPFNPDLDPMKGVAGAATMGGVLGAATGAGTSLLTGNPNARARKPSEDLGLDPSNGPLSKVAAAAVDAAASTQPQQEAAPDNGLSLQPVEQPQAPMVPSMAERLESLPQQARDQADQLLREIADERTPEGVKRFRANELQQLLDANPMPQVPSMDIPEEDRIAMRPIVRGFDPSTGQAPAQPLGLVDAQPQYEGGIDFEQQPQAEPSSLIQLAEWYERSAQGNRDAANPVGQVQQQVRQGTQYTDAAQVQAARQAVEDAWLSLNVGESVSQAQADGGPGVEAAPADLTAETNTRLRAGRVASGVRNAFDDGAPNTLRVIQYVNQGLRTIGEQPLTSPEIARIRRLADARTAFAGLNQPAPLPADRQTTPTDTAADNSSMESLIPVRRAAAQSTTTQQGNANGTAAPFDNAPQTVAPSPAQSQAPAPALPQPAGVADATQATQAQQTGAQPQAPGAAAAEGAGQAAPAQSTPVERKRSAGDHARSRSYAANPMRAFLAKHGVNLDSRSEFAPGLQEIRGTLVPGYGPMFRKSGKPLDTLVQNAVEEGFLPEGATESDLYELIDRAVRRGERVAPMYTESAAESEFEAMAARQAEFAREDYEADRAAQDAEAVEYEAVLAQEFSGLNDEQLAELDASAPDLDAGSNTTTEAAMRALGFSEKEIQDAVAREQGVAPEARQRGSEAVQADTRGAQARTGASQGDALQSYTEAELKQRQEAQEKAEAEAAKAEREAAAKEKTERERKEISARQAASAENFELGQDPMASLSGQASIFDAPQELAKAQAKAAPKQETAAGKDGYFDRAKALGIKSLRVGMKQDALKQRVKAFLAGERASNLVEAGKKTDLPQYQGVPDAAVRDFAELVDANQYSIDTSDATWVLDARGMSGIDALVESGLLNEGDAKYKHTLTPVGKEIARRLLTKPIGDMSTSDMLDEIDAGNAANDDQAETVAQTVRAAKPANRIEDVGEKIGGARKDVWTGFRDEMGAVPDEAIAAQPLSKVWPQPDYQKLIEAGHDASTVAMVRSLRDAIPTKPRQSYKVKRWAEQVKELRAFALEMMDGQLPHQKLRTELLKAGSRDLRGIVGRAQLYEAVGHGQSLEGISFAEHFYTLYKGKPNVTLWAVEHDAKSSTFGNWPRELATGDTKEQALEAFKKLHSNQAKQEAKANVPSFDIWSMRRTGDIYVGKKIGRNYAELAGPFKTVREAREYRDQHLDELTSKLEKYKETPAERADINRPRVGQDMRQGLDVTPEQFREAFGFRGVEFGNWVEQGRRQQDLNDAFDALMDMAAILQLPPKAISLNGELGLAFGARGAGGKNPAAAHYERGKVVINLTKRSGAGSLGHEWWHAVDNYFGRMRGQADGMLTEASDVSVLSRGPAKTFAPNSNVRQEMVQAFAEVIKAINNTSLRARAANLDSRRVKEYWGTDPELSARAFESYLIAKLEDQNASNDYLANVVDEKFWEAQAALGMRLEGSYPYAKAGEVPVIRAAFDHFFNTVETKETDKGVAMFSRTERPAVSNTTAVQMRRAMVQRTVGSLTQGWGQSPRITVVDSMSDPRVPEAVREADQAQRSQGATGEPEGFWYQGQVYLVASALPTSADATRVLYHEVLGHHGLRGHFGAELDKVLDQVAKLRRKDVAAKASEYGLDMGNPDHVAYAAEEVLAELAQTRPDLGFVQRAIAAIRNFLRSHVPGMQHLTLTDADIVQGYLLPARGWVERSDTWGNDVAQARFSFAGQGAATADLGNLQEAQRRVAAGDNAERVRRETGWHQGVDDKWRFEISDHEAAFRGGDAPSEFSIDRVQDGDVRALWEVISHDKLFAAYPSLRSLPVSFAKDYEFRGGYYPGTDRIAIKISNDPKQMLSTLLHELQHAIQHREGFATGGSLSPEFIENVRLALNELPKAAKAVVDGWVSNNQQLVNEANAAEQLARQALLYESAQRLMAYANRESPSGVMRLIRNEMQWLYSEHLRDNPDAIQLQRDFWSIPKPSNLPKRNAFLRDFAYRGAQLLQSSITTEVLQQFRSDARTMTSLVASLRRASDRARAKLQPLHGLKREAANAQSLKEAHDFSGAYDIYQSIAGEIEARNTQARQGMTDEQRKAMSPWETADVSKSKTIVVYNGTEIAAPSMEAVRFSRAPSEQSEAFKQWYGDWQNAGHEASQTDSTPNAALDSRDRADRVRALRGSENVDATVDRGNDGVRHIGGAATFDGASGPTGAGGTPLRLYHGTRDDITAFNLNHPNRKDHGWLGDGVYLTNDPDTAFAYSRAKRGPHGSNVMPLYANVRNPYVATAAEKIATRNSGTVAAKALTDRVKALGHDGVVLDLGGGVIELVAFEPTQVKSTTGNNGNYDPANPDIRYSRSQPADAIRSSMGNMTPDQERAYLAVAGYDKVPTLRERFDQLKANLGLRMKQALVDQFAPIAQLDQQAYMLARMSKGSDGTLEAALLYGRPFLRDGVPDVDMKDGGFAKVLAGLQGEHDRFLMHVAAQRAENLKAQGKENLFSDQDITSLKTLNDGLMPDGSSRKQAYAKALAQLNSFNESVLRMAKESGLIDQDAYDLMRDQPYVPFYRLMEEEGGLQGPSFSKGLTNQKAWKKLKGGTEQLNADLLQNMLLNWGNLYAASARNRAALATMDAAEKMAVAYKVPSDTKGAAKVMRDGVTEHWMVEDPYLLEAISALHYQASPLMKPLAKAKQWLTIGVTVNPTFKVRNLIRDVVSSMAMADLSYNPASNLAKGWKLTARDSQVYASMLASGGVIKFGTQEQTDRARKQVAKLSGVVLDQNGAKKLWSQVKALYAVYDEFGDRTENINRAALYDRLIAKGYNHAEASFMARDLMDFSMGGSAPVVRFLTQSVPFLNARMQGLYKLGRAAKHDPRRFATVAMAVTVASLGLLAAYADDEDWKRREDWDRDSYWWFKIGETAYRIPKPFEVGAIGTLAERTAEAMFSEEMDSKRFMERISHMVSQTFAFDPMPQAFKPLLDIYANKDSFTGRAIESQADQRLRPEDRYNERTSEVARFLGQVGLPDPARLMKGEYAGLSPKQIDHLLRGYFSWMATASTVASDMLLRNTVVDRGESPALRLKDVFLVGNFAEGLPSGSSRYVSAMYEQSKPVEQAYAAYRDALASGDHAKASEIMGSSGELIRSRGAVNTATKLLAQLNSQAKRVQADTNMSSDEKRERLTRIEQRRHEIAKRVMGSSVT